MNRFATLIAFLIFCGAILSAQQRPIDQEFLEAVQRKDIPKINLLLSTGANVNAQDRINGYFALQYAINWPDVNLVKLLLDKGANVNLADDGGTTALINATRGDKPEYTAIVKLLLQHGADIHADQDAAVFGAVREAPPEVVRLLLEKGAPVNARDYDSYGDTVLMEAAGGGSVETVKMLLTAGADIKAINKNGQTALMKAVTLDHRYSPSVRLPMIEVLLKVGSDINAKDKKGLTPLHHSVVQYMSEAGGVLSHPEVVKFLLDHGADVQAKDELGNTALITTVGVWQGPIEIVRLLLAKGIDVNAQNEKGTTALMIAADKGKRDVVDILLEKGADLNISDADGGTALDYAIGTGQTEIAKYLFARSAKSKNNYKSQAELLAASTNFALLEAAARNKLTEVKDLLALGADVNSRNRLNKTPLMLAVESSYSQTDVVAFLIEKGADLNAVDSDGNTAIMIASSRNNAEVVEMLLGHKASVLLRNKDGQTALHIAAAKLNAKIVAALLESKPQVGVSSAGTDVRGVDVDGVDPAGRTPLMLAADNEGYVLDDVMQVLLAKGAQIDAQDPQGNTPLIIAAKAGSMSGVRFLLKKGASVNLKNTAGETALKFAKKIHENKRIINAEIVEERVVAMLVRAGAKE